MRAEQIYAALDRAGLTPPVHYCAAPDVWRTTLEALELEIEKQIINRIYETEDDE